MTVLRFKLPTGSAHVAAIERLGAAGLTEPLVGIGTPGVIALAYERELTADELASLIAEITHALPGSEIQPMDSDLGDALLQMPDVGKDDDFARK